MTKSPRLPSASHLPHRTHSHTQVLAQGIGLLAPRRPTPREAAATRCASHRGHPTAAHCRRRSGRRCRRRRVHRLGTPACRPTRSQDPRINKARPSRPHQAGLRGAQRRGGGGGGGGGSGRARCGARAAWGLRAKSAAVPTRRAQPARHPAGVPMARAPSPKPDLDVPCSMQLHPWRAPSRRREPRTHVHQRASPEPCSLSLPSPHGNASPSCELARSPALAQLPIPNTHSDPDLGPEHKP